jgi:hypothetical protein
MSKQKNVTKQFSRKATLKFFPFKPRILIAYQGKFMPN